MRMNPIDELFEKGLDEKGLEYSGAQWAEMEQLLETKKGIFGAASRKYVIAGLTLVVLFLTYWLWPTTTLDTTQNTTTTNAPNVEKLQGADLLTPHMAEGNGEAVLASSENGIESETTNVEHIEANRDERMNLSSNGVDEVNTDEAMLNGGEEAATEGMDALASSRNDGGPSEELNSGLKGRAEEVENVEEIHTLNPEENIASQPANGSNTLSIAQAEYVEDIVIEDVVVPTPKADVEVLAQRQEGESVVSDDLVSSEDLFKPVWSFHVVPYGSYTQHKRRSLAVEHVRDLKNTEETVMQSGFGLNVMAKRKNLVFKVGVEQLRMKEKTNYVTPAMRYTYDTTLVLVKSKYTQTPRGMQVALVKNRIDSTGTEYQRVECPDCEVQFSYLNVPIGMQYEFHNGRFVYYLEFGGNIAFLSSKTGRYVLRDAPVADGNALGELGEATVINTTMLQLDGGAGVKYRLYDGISLWTGYRYGLGLGSMFNSYNQKVGVQRLSAGLEFKF